VRVSIDPTGRPVRIVDIDRIVVAAKGDYSFAIAAPVEDVRAAPGSRSEPGLRSQTVIWQGFSPGRRLLAAEITLRTSAAGPALPLRIEVGRAGLRLVNAASARVTAPDAPVRASEIAQVLDGARAALLAGTPTPAPVVDAIGPVRDVRVISQVPLHVRGTVRFDDHPPRTFAGVVGRRAVEIAGTGRLKLLELSVSVPAPASVLRPPGAHRWRDLARSGRLINGRKATRLAVNRLLAAGLAIQFRRFLANPDAAGVTRTSYLYELAVAAKAPEARSQSDGYGWVVTVGIAIGLVAVATAALVVWAHS
jgi:hypothetical protein